MGGGHEPDCGQQALNAAVFSGIAGGIVGALQAAWTDKPMIKDQTTAHVKFAASNIMRAATVFAATGAFFASGKCFAKDMRQKDDGWNAVAGGFAGGAVLGASLRSMPAAVAAMGMMGLVAGAVDYQSRLYGVNDTKAIDVFQALKKKKAEHE